MPTLNMMGCTLIAWLPDSWNSAGSSLYKFWGSGTVTTILDLEWEIHEVWHDMTWNGKHSCCLVIWLPLMQTEVKNRWPNMQRRISWNKWIKMYLPLLYWPDLVSSAMRAFISYYITTNSILHSSLVEWHLPFLLSDTQWNLNKRKIQNGSCFPFGRLDTFAHFCFTSTYDIFRLHC